MRAGCSPTIGPRRTITGPQDQWEVCIHGKETLGTSLHNMSAPARGSKRSDATKKVRAQAAPFAKKKRRLKVPDDRGGEGETHLQPPAIPK